jgi:hypothetical protein
MEQILAALGAGTGDVLAAFLGSVCAAFLLTKPSIKSVIATIFIGTVVGTYFGPHVPLLIGVTPANWITLIIGSFGTGGLLLVQDFVRKKLNGDSK